MGNLKYFQACLALVGLIAGVGFASAAAEQMSRPENSCVVCHSELPDTSFVGAKSHGWKGSVHHLHGVTCDNCHGGNPGAMEKSAAHAGMLGSSNPQSPVYFKNIPATCGKCHGAESYKFTQSLHYKKLEATGQGPECVTCHGSMVTKVLAPDSLAAVCNRCHNERMGIFPEVPQKAKAVLLLLRESKELLGAEEKLYPHPLGSAATRSFGEARGALHSAVLEWHRFDLDAITDHLQHFFQALQELPHNQPQEIQKK